MNLNNFINNSTEYIMKKKKKQKQMLKKVCTVSMLGTIGLMNGHLVAAQGEPTLDQLNLQLNEDLDRSSSSSISNGASTGDSSSSSTRTSSTASVGTSTSTSTTTTSASGEQGTTKPSVEATQLSQNSYLLTVKNVPRTINKVQIPFWSEKNGQDDIVWYEATYVGEGSWQVQVNLTNHKSDTGVYHIHVYGAEAGVGNLGALAASTLNHVATTGKAEASLQVVNHKPTSGSFDVLVKGEPNGQAIRSVAVAVWTQENGQDDLVWYTPSVINNTAVATVDSKNHGNASGNYIVHAYVEYEEAGKKGYDLGMYKIEQEKVQSEVKTQVKQEEVFIKVSSNDVANYTDLRVAVWSEEKGQDDLVWHHANAAGEVLAKFADQTSYGLYHIHVYTSERGKMRFVASTTITRQIPNIKTAIEKQADGNYLVTVSGLSGEYSSVAVPVWSENKGQDDIIWYEAQRQANGNFQALISPSRHNNDTGLYHVHVYARSVTGSLVGIDAKTFTVEGLKLQTVVEKQTNGSYRVTVNGIPSGYQSVLIPTWSEKSGQDDIVWYKADKHLDGSFRIDIHPSQHKNDSGIYHSHIYAHAAGGNLVALDAKSYKVETTTLSPKTSIQQLTENHYQISITGIPSEVASVLVPTWSENNGQDDIVWYKATKQANGSYTVDVHASQHKSDRGQYHAHVYAQDSAGQLTAVDAKSFTVEGARLQTKVEKVSSETYRIQVAGLPSSVENLVVPTWSENNGQDDIVWYMADKQSNGTFTVTVQLKNHKFDSGKYHAHLYSKDRAGALTGLGAVDNFTVDPTAKATGRVEIVNVSKENGRFDVVVHDVPSTGVKEVLVPVWSENGGQDDIVWYSAGRQANGTYRVSVDTGRHNYDAGRYHVHVYTKSMTDQLEAIGATSAVIEKATNRTGVQVTYSGSGNYHLVFNNLHTSGEIKYAVWSDSRGQDDIYWYSANRQNGSTFVGSFNAQNHRDTGVYHVHVYEVVNGRMNGLSATTVDVSKADFSAPYYSQLDPRWSNISYGNWKFGPTGCVPTVMAMIINAVSDYNVSPVDVGNYLYHNTSEFNRHTIGTTSRGIVNAAHHWGLKTEVLNSQNAIVNALQSGHYVAAAVGPSKFVAGGTHELVLKGYSNGNTYVLDPYNAANNGWYSVQHLWNIQSTDPTDLTEGRPFIRVSD